MLKKINVKKGVQLADYEAYAELVMAVRNLQTEAEIIVPKLKGRKVWMISSTAKGGGVAEMMPRKVSLLRQLGLKVDWLVIHPEQKDFFNLTKHIHNLIHGEEETEITEAQKEIFESVNRTHAEELADYITTGDIVVIHDPQPVAMAKWLDDNNQVKLIWRCHIGYENHTRETRRAWQFLKPYLKYYDHGIFTAPEYIPDFMTGRSTVIPPSIDPLTHKNRDLSVYKLVGILCNSQLVKTSHTILTPNFPNTVQQLKPDGSFGSPIQPSEIGLLFSPVVTQVSRWDKLKGFDALLEGFVHLKKNKEMYVNDDQRHRKRLTIVKLVLAGPEPASIKDDPEGQQVIKELSARYQSLPGELQRDIAILMLPMDSRKNNALIVNALQRCSTIIAQNSYREGFGLTATEAMWKVIPLMIGNACGLRQQVRDKIDGRVVQNPKDPEQIAEVLNDMLRSPKEREVWAYSAQKRVYDQFLVFVHLQKWLNVFTNMHSLSA